jgi:hypothetical protein
MPISVNVGGVWKTPSQVAVNIGGVWKNALSMYVNVNGTWVLCFGGLSPLNNSTSGYLREFVFPSGQETLGATQSTSWVVGREVEILSTGMYQFSGTVWMYLTGGVAYGGWAKNWNQTHTIITQAANSNGSWDSAYLSTLTVSANAGDKIQLMLMVTTASCYALGQMKKAWCWYTNPYSTDEPFPITRTLN